MSSATSLVRTVLRGAGLEGAEAAALLGQAGLSPDVVADRDVRVPTSAYLRVFAAAEARDQAATLGPAAARALDPATFGLPGFLVASCATMRDALRLFARYTRLLCDELQVELHDDGRHTAIRYSLDVEPRVGALFEMAFVHLVSTSRWGTRGAFQPTEVTFRHRAAPRTLPSLLRAPVVFGAVQDAVICETSQLSLPLRGSNPALLTVLESHAELVLRSLPAENDLLAQIRRAMLVLLPHGEPTLATVARQLGLGPRTLQRRLGEQALTFRTVLDEVRRESALQQLAQPDVSIAEVAFALGFSSPSAFHHAFRRWTGRSPRQAS